MARLIKKAEKEQVVFNIGDKIYFNQYFHDGRSYENIKKQGEIVKINLVSVDMKDEKGNVWRVGKDEAKFN
jgi:hypothetical protein